MYSRHAGSCPITCKGPSTAPQSPLENGAGMDLTILRQSLHRLALLDDAGGQDPPGISLSKAVGGGVWRDEVSPQTGAGPGKGEQRRKSRRHRADPVGPLPRSGPQGGIRVYEGDDWDLSSSDSGRKETLGNRRTPLMRLRVLMNGVPTLLCVSMGSNVNILKPEIAKRARLSVIKMKQPIWLSLDIGDGPGPRMPVDYRVSSAPYQIDDFFAQDEFLVTPALTTSYVDGIVGIDWLEKYKPTVNYRLNRIELIDLRGRVFVIESVPGSERAGRGENETQWITARMRDWDLKPSIPHLQHQSQGSLSDLD